MVFRLCGTKIVVGGWFTFSIELLPEDHAKPFCLVQSGRFQHKHSYIVHLATAHGFQIVHEQSVVVRKESSEAIQGQIYVLRNEARSVE